MSTDARFTNATGAPVADNTNIQTADPRGPALLQDIWLLEKLANLTAKSFRNAACMQRAGVRTGRSRSPATLRAIPGAKIFSEVGKKTPMFVRFSTVAGERGAGDAERDIRVTAISAIKD
jgi:catalase